MLAPSVERSEGAAHQLGLTARDLYPAYVDWLLDRTGISVPLNRLGVLQVALSPAGVKGLRRNANAGTQWLDRAELPLLEPSLSHALGALHSPNDGCVDNVLLLGALDVTLSRTPRVRRITARVTAIEATLNSVAATDSAGARYDASHLVVAAGAWSGQIEGARYAGAVVPVRGQLVSYATVPCRHTLYGPRGYLVPRGGTAIAGSTMEQVGYSPETTDDGIARVRAAGEEICPELGRSAPLAAWAGLRPVTPDLLPLLGADPELPRLIYATGHSRNGVLLAPLTAEVVSALIFEAVLNLDISQYRPDRF